MPLIVKVTRDVLDVRTVVSTLPGRARSRSTGSANVDANLTPSCNIDMQQVQPCWSRDYNRGWKILIKRVGAAPSSPLYANWEERSLPRADQPRALPLDGGKCELWRGVY